MEREAHKRKATYEFLFVESNGSQLGKIAQLLEQQSIRPSIDKVFTFDQTNEALAKVAQAGSTGKVVLTFVE